MIKENLYEGAVADDAPVPQMALPRDVSSEVLAKGLQQVGANLDSAVMEGVRMEDARKEFEAGMLIDACADGVKFQVEAGLQAADGSDESFFDKHGQLRQGKVEGLRNEVLKRLGSVGASIVDPQVRFRVAAKAQQAEQEILSGLQETWERVNRQKTETAWKDRYDLAVARGQYDEAAGLLDRGVELNMFSMDRAEIMRLGLKATAEKERLAKLKLAEKNSKVAADSVSFELLESLQSGDAPAEKRGEEKKLTGAETEVDTLAEERMETLELGLDVSRAASITLGNGGNISVKLAEAPSDVSKWQAARASHGGYTLKEHRLDVMQVAAAVLSDENYAGLTDKQRRDMIMQRVRLVGGAQLFFDGDEAAYEGWIMNQAEQLSGLGGVVKKTDRMLAGYGGGKGINALLNEEVTEQEVRNVWEGDRLLNDKSEVGIKAREALYTKYRDAWVNATGAEPKAGIIAAGDLSDFLEWYKEKGGLHDQRRAAFVKGVRDVYTQKAMTAVLDMRAQRKATLSDGTVVELDGQNDWAVEQRVIRDVLGVPLTRADYGTLEALAHQEAVMADARRKRARLYAGAGRDSSSKVAGFNEAENKVRTAALFAEPEMPALDAAVAREAAERAESARKKADRAAVLNKQLRHGVAVNARWDGKKGDGSPMVSMPAAAYAKIAESLDAKNGFFVILPGSSEPVPVAPDKGAKGVVFNKSCIGMLKKGKFSKAELGKVVNGAAIKMKFTKDSVRYDF